MKKLSLLAVTILVVAVSVALAGGFKSLKASLVGFNEPPSLSTPASGEFRAHINNDETQIDWEMTYSNIESTVQQSHIHLGQKSVNGGISVFLCTNLGNGPAGTQACPQTTGGPVTISGTIVAADVSPAIPATQAARNQGLNTGEIAELVRAIRAGSTYVNVHSSTFPGGEIRDQIGSGHVGHGEVD